MPGTRDVWVEKTHVREDGFPLTIPLVEIVDMVGDQDLTIQKARVTRSNKPYRSNSEETSAYNSRQASTEILVNENPLMDDNEVNKASTMSIIRLVRLSDQELKLWQL